jgi:hypothetical protein
VQLKAVFAQRPSQPRRPLERLQGILVLGLVEANGSRRDLARYIA